MEPQSEEEVAIGQVINQRLGELEAERRAFAAWAEGKLTGYDQTIEELLRLAQLLDMRRK